MSLPMSYVNASWRCTLPVDAERDRLGLALNLADASIVRVALDVKSARHVAETILAYLDRDSGFQSPKSAGSSSCDGSPQEGHDV